MKPYSNDWLSKKLWFSVALIAVATWMLIKGFLGQNAGIPYLVFLGSVGGAFLYLQGQIDASHLKFSAGPQGVTIDDKQEAGK